MNGVKCGLQRFSIFDTIDELTIRKGEPLDQALHEIIQGRLRNQLPNEVVRAVLERGDYGRALSTYYKQMYSR